MTIRYGEHDVTEEDVQAVLKVLRGDWLSTGPHVARFEKDLANVAGCQDAVSMSSGTAALHAAYAAAGIGDGDEIITSPLTFIATQAAAMMLGAKPVFADIRQETGTIDPASIEALITDRTVAIAAIDYAGHPCDLDELRDIATKHGLLLIEDAAHSLGSCYKGMPIGSISDLTVFSFFPTKNITTGEGGAVTARDSKLLGRARRFARQGLVRDPTEFRHHTEGAWHQEVHEIGLNYRLPDILAALGSSQISRIFRFKARRAYIKTRYDEALHDLPSVVATPHQDLHADPMWHLYPLRVEKAVRKHLFDALRLRGIQVQVNYLPAYWHPALEDRGFQRGLCPIAEEFYGQEISLPLHTKLTDDDVERVISEVSDILLTV